MDPVTALIVASALDPIRALITFAFSVLARSAVGMLIAATASAVLCETILTTAHVWRFWGQGLVAGFIACVIQAVALYWAMKVMRRRKALAATGR
jgi:hypothetical protein